jgi:hypothetical protein
VNGGRGYEGARRGGSLEGFWKCFRVGGGVWVCYGSKIGLGGGVFFSFGGPKLENGGPEIDFGVMSTFCQFPGFRFGLMSEFRLAGVRKWQKSGFWRHVDIAKMSVFGVQK